MEVLNETVIIERHEYYSVCGSDVIRVGYCKHDPRAVNFAGQSELQP